MISNLILVYSTVYFTFCCTYHMTNTAQALKVDKRGAAYANTFCKTDADCYGWQACMNGKCDYKRICFLDDCPSGQICRNAYCRYSRSLGQSCDGVWEICTKNMQCTADASGTKKCVCTIDSDCPDDSWCKNSTCISRQTNCTKNSDCPSDSHCVDGHCKAQRYGKCTTNENCDTGLSCIRGKCEYYCPGYGVCYGDLRCYNNTKCMKPTNLHKNCSSSDTCRRTTKDSICDLRSRECRCSDGYEEIIGIEVVFCKKVFQMPLYGTIIISIVVAVILVLFIRQSYVAFKLRLERIARRDAARRDAAINARDANVAANWIAAREPTRAMNRAANRQSDMENLNRHGGRNDLHPPLYSAVVPTAPVKVNPDTPPPKYDSAEYQYPSTIKQ